jgi:hypothetical protein
MTTINSISSSVLSRSFTTDTTNNNSISQVSGPPPPPPPGGGIMSAVLEALSQMGLRMDLSSTASRTDASSNTSSTDPAASTSTAQKALYKFMHDLFSAMQDQASGTSSSRAYSPPMTASIQDVIQALASSNTTSDNTSDSGTASTQISGLSNLQLDFQSLVTAMGGDSATGSSSTGLQAFLQNLESNLNQQGSSSINFINTTA